MHSHLVKHTLGKGLGVLFLTMLAALELKTDLLSVQELQVYFVGQVIWKMLELGVRLMVSVLCTKPITQYLCSFIQLLVVCATMEMFVLLMGQTSMRAEWRYVSMICGGLSVMTTGTPPMLQLCANSLVSHFSGVSTHLNF